MPSSSLPAGTVTFLFTDIEGSTELLKQLKDQYASLLADQRRILREVFSRCHGKEVDSQGDAFFYSFSKATEAANAAVEVQLALAQYPWPEEAYVRVRIGLHTGEPLIEEEGYIGIDVHRAARIAHAGHGGQVLLSETTTPLVIDELPEGVTLLDLGRHQLKDMLRPEHISQLVIDGLPNEFPPLKSLGVLGKLSDRPKHNLPHELTPFIGRDHEIEALIEQLHDPSQRLLSMVGIGGIGKTRLALQVANRLVDDYPDGVWCIEFADLRDPKLVPQKAANVMSVSAFEEIEGRDIGDVLAAYLRDKRLLMILDNCEHLIEACGRFAEKLLRECPKVQLIATSRENLGIVGERLYLVPTMGIPSEEASSRNLAEFESVHLFVDRAMAVLSDFKITHDNSYSIADICKQLDGIPLAIELAAARVKILAPEQIAERLQDRFQLLCDGPRTALPRQQTLQATMEWSYELLTVPEKQMLCDLAVFAGGWTMEGLEGLVQEEFGSSIQIIDLLSHLVDKSLVVVEHKKGSTRYSMLETVRQFAEDKLSTAEDVDDLRQRHAMYFLELAEEADPKLRSSDQMRWLEILDAEHDNIRTALSYLIEVNLADGAARLVAALGWYWFLRGYWREAWNWLTKVLNILPKPAPNLQARAMYKAGALDIIRGNLSGRVELVEEALEVCQDTSDDDGAAWCLNLLGQAMTWSRDNLDKGADFLSESIKLFRKLGDQWGVAWSTRYLGQMEELQGNVDQSINLQRAALHRFENLGDVWNVAHSLYLLGHTVRDRGEFDEAQRLYHESYSNCQLVKDNVIGAHALQGLGMVAMDTHQYREAGEYLREALEIMQRIGDEHCASRVLGNLAKIAHHDGDYNQAIKLQQECLQGFIKINRKDRIALNLLGLATFAKASGFSRHAASLLGIVEAYRGSYQVVLTPADREEYERLLSGFEDIRGDAIFEQDYAFGFAMDPDDAMAYALDEWAEI